MAAPHVCGAAALLESVDPNLTGPQKFDLLVQNTNPYNDERILGSGILDVHQAMLALGTLPPPPENRTVESGKL